MPIQFRDGDREEPRKIPNQSVGASDNAMEELREMFKRGDNNPFSDEEINQKFGPDALEMVGRVQVRLDELVNAMQAFNDAREAGDDEVTTQKLMEFTRLLSQTTQRYNSMEIGSLLATGIAAIAEIERHLKGDGDAPE